MAHKGRGWHGEPGRHSKAARGIKTAKHEATIKGATESRLFFNYSAARMRFLSRQILALARMYQKDSQDLHSQTDWMSPGEFLHVLDKSIVGRYNEFDPNELAHAIASTRGIREVKFGRDFSPVLYIRVERGKMSSVFNNFRRHMRAENRPNEWDFDDREKFGEGVIRAWWD